MAYRSTVPNLYDNTDSLSLFSYNLNSRLDSLSVEFNNRRELFGNLFEDIKEEATVTEKREILKVKSEYSLLSRQGSLIRDKARIDKGFSLVLQNAGREIEITNLLNFDNSPEELTEKVPLTIKLSASTKDSTHKMFATYYDEETERWQLLGNVCNVSTEEHELNQEETFKVEKINFRSAFTIEQANILNENADLKVKQWIDSIPPERKQAYLKATFKMFGNSPYNTNFLFKAFGNEFAQKFREFNSSSLTLGRLVKSNPEADKSLPLFATQFEDKKIYSMSVQAEPSEKPLSNNDELIRSVYIESEDGFKTKIGSFSGESVELPLGTKFLGSVEIAPAAIGEIKLDNGVTIPVSKMREADIKGAFLREEKFTIDLRQEQEITKHEVFLNGKKMGDLDKSSAEIWQKIYHNDKKPLDVVIDCTGSGYAKSLDIKLPDNNYLRITKPTEKVQKIRFNETECKIEIKPKVKKVNRFYASYPNGRTLSLGEYKNQKLPPEVAALQNKPQAAKVSSFPSTLLVKVEADTLDYSAKQDVMNLVSPKKIVEEQESNRATDYMLEKASQLPLIAHFRHRNWQTTEGIVDKSTVDLVVEASHTDKLLAALSKNEIDGVPINDEASVRKEEERGLRVISVPSGFLSQEKLQQIADDSELGLKQFDSLTPSKVGTYENYLSNLSIKEQNPTLNTVEDLTFPLWQEPMVEKDNFIWAINLNDDPLLNWEKKELAESLAEAGISWNVTRNAYLVPDRDLTPAQRSLLESYTKEIPEGISVSKTPSLAVVELSDILNFGTEIEVLQQLNRLDVYDRAWLQGNVGVDWSCGREDFDATAITKLQQICSDYLTNDTALVYQHSIAGSFSSNRSSLENLLGKERVGLVRSLSLDWLKNHSRPKLISDRGVESIPPLLSKIEKSLIPFPRELKRGQIPTLPVVFGRDFQDPLVDNFREPTKFTPREDLIAQYKKVFVDKPELLEDITHRGGANWLDSCSTKSNQSFFQGQGIKSGLINALKFAYLAVEKEQQDLKKPVIRGKNLNMSLPLLGGSLPTDNSLDAMRGYGKTHVTRNCNLCRTHGFKEGDIAIARDGDRTIAFRVGREYKLSSELIQDKEYCKAWAATEKQSPDMLGKLFGKAISKGEDVYGLEMKPLGDYVNGKIVPFPPVEKQNRSSISISPSEIAAKVNTLKRTQDAPTTVARKNSSTTKDEFAQKSQDSVTFQSQKITSQQYQRDRNIPKRILENASATNTVLQDRASTSKNERKAPSKVSQSCNSKVNRENAARFNSQGRTADQQIAYDKLSEFLNDYTYVGKENVFLLKGYAGTGKTHTIQAAIKDAVKQSKLKVAFVAPTHKATGVIGSMAKEQLVPISSCKTLASLLDVKVDYDFKTGEETWKTPYTLEDLANGVVPEGDFNNLDVVVIDEASMISRQNYEYAVAVLAAAGKKVIFMGDDAQLPPVNEFESHVFSDPEVTKSHTLTEVVRYEGEIAKLSFAMREKILQIKEAAGELELENLGLEIDIKTSETGDIIKAKSNDWLKNTLAMFTSPQFQENPNYVKAIAYRNERVTELNQVIRTAVLGNNLAEYVPGDLITTKSPAPIVDSRSKINKAADLQVISATKGTSAKYGFKVWQLEVKDLTTGNVDKIEAVARESLAEYQQAVKKLFNASRKIPAHQKQMRKDAFAEAYRLKSAFGVLDYNYAITTHSAQGSTYENVALDKNDLDVRKAHADRVDNFADRRMILKEYLQLLYTASTRARNSMLIADDTELVRDFVPDVLQEEQFVSTNLASRNERTNDAEQELNSLPDYEANFSVEEEDIEPDYSWEEVFGVEETAVQNLSLEQQPNSANSTVRQSSVEKNTPDPIEPSAERSTPKPSVPDKPKPQAPNRTFPGVKISHKEHGFAAALSLSTEIAKFNGSLSSSYPVSFRDNPFRSAKESRSAEVYQTDKPQGVPFVSAEDAYRHFESGCQNNSQRRELMVEVLTAKLAQHPRLVEEIDRRGGKDWLMQCSFKTNAGSEAQGTASPYVASLIAAYFNVKEQKLEQTDARLSSQQVEERNKNEPTTASSKAENKNDRELFSLISLVNEDDREFTNLAARVSEALTQNKVTFTLDETFRSYGLQTRSKTARSLMVNLKNVASEKELRLQAAWLGKLVAKPQVSYFIADPKGKSISSTLTLQTNDIKGVSKALKEQGLTKFNLVAKNNTIEVRVIDTQPNKSTLIALSGVLTQYDGQIRTQKGRAELIRSREYDGIITPNSRENGTSDRRREDSNAGVSRTNSNTDPGGRRRPEPGRRTNLVEDNRDSWDNHSQTPATWLQQQTKMVVKVCNTISRLMNMEETKIYEDSRYTADCSQDLDTGVFSMNLQCNQTGQKIMSASFIEGKWHPEYLPASDGASSLELSYFQQKYDEAKGVFKSLPIQETVKTTNQTNTVKPKSPNRTSKKAFEIDPYS